TILNIAAVILYFFIWAGYEILFDSRFRRPDSLNAKMVLVRNAWAARMLTRDTSLVDSNLVGHTIHTATFMASTTVLILAGFRGYYFAFAAVGWIAHPLVLVLGALFTVTVLVRRQLYSRVARAIRDYAGWLGDG